MHEMQVVCWDAETKPEILSNPFALLQVLGLSQNTASCFECHTSRKIVGQLKGVQVEQQAGYLV